MDHLQSDVLYLALTRSSARQVKQLNDCGATERLTDIECAVVHVLLQRLNIAFGQHDVNILQCERTLTLTASKIDRHNPP
jgi:hypothetical protein